MSDCQKGGSCCGGKGAKERFEEDYYAKVDKLCGACPKECCEAGSWDTCNQCPDTYAKCEDCPATEDCVEEMLSKVYEIYQEEDTEGITIQIHKKDDSMCEAAWGVEQKFAQYSVNGTFNDFVGALTEDEKTYVDDILNKLGSIYGPCCG